MATSPFGCEPIRPIGPAVLIACVLLAMTAVFAPRSGAAAPPATPIPPVNSTGKVPSGTILPVVLDSSLSFSNAKTGQVLMGKIAQDVPLPDGSKIRRGSAVQGHVTEVVPSSSGIKVTMRFDRVRIDGAWIPVVTDLRAMAGFMTVQEAHVPIEAPGEGDVYDWLPTSQIGGDTVYGLRGPVMSAENPSEVIGVSVSNGVLAKISASHGCRGNLENGEQRQALWVFSGDACGIYGIGHLKIDHAGRSDPQGSIILVAEAHNVKLNNGDGMLLRVD
jgi:hypothetical protein